MHDTRLIQQLGRSHTKVSNIIYKQCLRTKSHQTLVPQAIKSVFSFQKKKLSNAKTGWQMCVGRLLQSRDPALQRHNHQHVCLH